MIVFEVLLNWLGDGISELALEISFFARDDDAIDEDEADWHGEEHPRRIDQDRQPKRPQSETDIH